MLVRPHKGIPLLMSQENKLRSCGVHQTLPPRIKRPVMQPDPSFGFGDCAGENTYEKEQFSHTLNSFCIWTFLPLLTNGSTKSQFFYFLQFQYFFSNRRVLRHKD